MRVTPAFSTTMTLFKNNYSSHLFYGDRIGGGRGAVENADVFFCFTIAYRTPLLQLPLYSQYQFFLYKTISNLRKKEISFNQIANWLNEKGYLSARGKSFKGNHVHSIIKKKRIKDEKLEKEYPEVRSDFRLETFEKRLINQV